MKKITLLLPVLLTYAIAAAQEFTEKISREFSFEKKSPDNGLMVANLNGHVKITGYDGDKIVVEVDRRIYAKTDARLAAAKEEVKLGIIDRADTIILYVEDGCNSFGRRQAGKYHTGWFNNGWGYNWNCRNNCQTSYDYKMDFVIRVPQNTHLMVSTINDGDVTVENVRGSVDAHNINGSIRLSNLVRESEASTINGDVDVEYAAHPPKDCRFYSLNGDINALFPKGLGASLSFESFNGEFYTNIDNLEALPVQVVKNTDRQGVRYKVNGNRYRVGNGGAYLDFETFNGNVYLKEKTN